MSPDHSRAPWALCPGLVVLPSCPPGKPDPSVPPPTGRSWPYAQKPLEAACGFFLTPLGLAKTRNQSPPPPPPPFRLLNRNFPDTCWISSHFLWNNSFSLGFLEPLGRGSVWGELFFTLWEQMWLKDTELLAGLGVVS